MNNTFSLEQLCETFNLDSKLILRQYKLHLMATFMEIKAMNPRITQKETAKELGYSISSLQRHRHDINMLPPYRITPKSHKSLQKASNRKCDL